MNEHSTDRQGEAAPSTPKNGWWWKFTALFMGAPPIAVYGAEDEVEQERAARAND
ncbi:MULTISPECIES: hypothetical protein [Microbacterium]|uniref:hypothetical protein n=1 Tax=Microbacterium TaxID=33882 RepID=UPI00286662FD|nr:hypothetical protein [Microbacterium trichothecenolyticum]MDR7186612.1 hypothetical protein [Microbacterium trichothecenolyticum]